MACRLPPGACRCQGEGGPEAEPRRGLAACALRLAPEAGPEGRGRPLPSAVARRRRPALAGGGWGLGVGADARGGVLACGRGGVGVGANRRKAGAHGQVETSSSMLGWASSKKLKKYIFWAEPRAMARVARGLNPPLAMWMVLELLP